MNRREALRTLAAGSAAGALAGSLVTPAVPAAEAAADPCLAFVTAWNRAFAECDRVQDAGHYETAVALFEFAARDGHVPAATTAAGAAAALRKIIALDDCDPQDKNLVLAALAYLDGAAS